MKPGDIVYTGEYVGVVEKIAKDGEVKVKIDKTKGMYYGPTGLTLVDKEFIHGLED